MSGPAHSGLQVVPAGGSRFTGTWGVPVGQPGRARCWDLAAERLLSYTAHRRHPPGRSTTSTASGWVITYTHQPGSSTSPRACGIIACFQLLAALKGWGWNPLLSLAPLDGRAWSSRSSSCRAVPFTVRSLMVTLFLAARPTAIWNPQPRIVPQFWPDKDVTILGVVVNYQQCGAFP